MTKVQLFFYDFGAMAEVKGLAKEQMVQTFFAMLQKDTDQVLNTLIYMGLIEPVGDMTAVKRLISFSLTRFLDKPIDVNAFKEISAEIYVMFEQQPFRLPPQLTFIIKALTTLDGIARTLDSNYSLLAASQPFVRNLTRSSNPTNILLLIAREGKKYYSKTVVKAQSPRNRFFTISTTLRTRRVTTAFSFFGSRKNQQKYLPCYQSSNLCLFEWFFSVGGHFTRINFVSYLGFYFVWINRVIQFVFGAIALSLNSSRKAIKIITSN